MNLTSRKANINDLKSIVQLLIDDKLGSKREYLDATFDDTYLEAFAKITSDPNQYLMVVLKDEEIVGTCHLTIMPSLTYKGATRMQIEAVRVTKLYRSMRIGEWMMEQALEYAKTHNVKIVQLTTNKVRESAKKFYERLGFSATHEGMKIFLDF